MGRKYGSKAAYEADRAERRDTRKELERYWSMSDHEREAERLATRHKEFVTEGEPLIFTALLIGAMAADSYTPHAIGRAEQALAEIKRRYVP